MDNKKRLRIGILLNFSGNWLGGVYYILNIIRSLNYLENDTEKPEVYLFYNPELENHVREVNYPYLKSIAWNFESLPRHYAISLLKQCNHNIDRITKEFDLDALFPVRDLLFKSKKRAERPKLISWYPDLQHKFYPDFFKKRELVFREFRTRTMLKKTDALVLSSHDVKTHFKKFYSIREDLELKVLQFVSIIDDMSFEPRDSILKRYGIPETYFLVSNQFLQHKNHLVVLKAIDHLKKNGEDVHVVITGKMDSVRFPKFIDGLKKFIEDHDLSPKLTLAGLVPRRDQLALMKYSKAVIQPSIFEGWSTVNEDAKTLQVPLIVSDIPVNREQLEDTAAYFEPDDYKKLAGHILKYQSQKIKTAYKLLEKRARRFAESFLEVTEQK